RRLGDIRQRLGHMEDAASAYRDALVLYEQADEVPLIQAARASTELGRVLRQLQKSDEGEKAIQSAVDWLDKAPPEVAHKPECRYELARSLLALGQRDMMRGPGDRPPPPPPPKRDGGRGPKPGGPR